MKCGAEKLNWATGQSLTPIGLERFFQRSTQAADSPPAAKMSKLPPRVPWRIKQSVAILAQVGIQAPGLSFPCICHLGNPIKTRFESGFCLLCSWPLLLVALSSSVGNLVVLDIYCPLSVVEYGFTAGKKPATCRTCGKTFPRPNVTLSDFLPAKSERKKENRSRNSSPGMSRRSRNVFPAVSRASIQKRTVKIQSLKTAPKLIRPRSTRRSRQTTKLWKIPTNMPEEHRTLIYGDSFKSKNGIVG